MLATANLAPIFSWQLIIPKISVGVYVPYAFAYECEHQWIATIGDLAGTKFKFTNGFVNSYRGDGWGSQGGPQETISRFYRIRTFGKLFINN